MDNRHLGPSPGLTEVHMSISAISLYLTCSIHPYHVYLEA